VTEAARAARVLVVAHEEETRVLLRRALRNAGYDVEVVTDAEQAVAALGRGLPALVVVDLRLPRREGWTLLLRLRARADGPRVVVLVPRADHRAFAQAIREGASAYAFLPFAPDDVVALCQTVLARAVSRPITGDERRHPRRLVAAEVSVSATDGTTVAAGDLVNLGAGGAQVRLAARLEPRTRVRLTLPVPVGQALSFEAVVQWSGRSASGFAHGLEFVDVTLALRRQLADLLEPGIG
jgi:DNA-binding response OmpR family regulator